MHLGFKKRWLVLPLVVVGLVAAGSLTALAQPVNEMAIDADPSTGAVDAVSPATAINDTLDVTVNVTTVGNDYSSYAYRLDISDTSNIQFTAATDLNPDVDSDTSADFLSCSTPSVTPGTVKGFCGNSFETFFTGQMSQVTIECLDTGQHTVDLSDVTVDPSAGTTTVDGAGNIDTGTTGADVVCEYQSDWDITKTDDPDPVVAGETLTYLVSMHNGGPNVSMGAVLADLLPIEKVLDGTPGVSDPPGGAVVPGVGTLLVDGSPVAAGCDWFETFDATPFGFGIVNNVVICDLSGALGAPSGASVPIPESSTITLELVVTVPVTDAGKANVNVALAGDLVNTDPDPSDSPLCDVLVGLGELPPSPENSVACEQTDVEPADVSIEKSPDASQYSIGDTITWSVTATSNGPSPASSVVITDTVGSNQSIVSGADGGGDVGVTCGAPVPAYPATANSITCTVDADMADGETAIADITAEVMGSEGNQCVNTGDVEWADPLSASTGPVTVPCFPPTVRMEKDVNDDPLTIEDEANLWICEGPTCDENGEGSLTVYERVVNVANDPDGAGAYEFQVKFNHKLFDIVVEDSSWLSNGGTRDVTCDMTIITENWILFGCVSSGPVPGNTADGVLATLTITPEPDMKYRLTPGQDNGVFDVILDENCEIADVLGDPLMLQDESGNDIGLAPGVLPGGLIEVCSDIGVTIRILEGDLNLDCAVDVLDQQAIAFRYGSSFGMLLYDDWYDLEPALKDFDIDIKDLQKVWGRQGSECSADGSGSIPPQPPVPFP